MSRTTFWARWALATAVGLGATLPAYDADASNFDRRERVRPKKGAVPEIPTGGTAAALTLILGATAVALDRRRRKAK